MAKLYEAPGIELIDFNKSERIAASNDGTEKPVGTACTPSWWGSLINPHPIVFNI